MGERAHFQGRMRNVVACTFVFIEFCEMECSIVIQCISELLRY